METRAKYVLIGAFVVGVCAIGLFLLLWAGKHSMDREFAHYDVYFREAITGLSKGGPVYYNGIQVGEVSALRLSRIDPARVIARIRVGASTPVKTDTTAKLAYTGLTGVAAIQLSGGSIEAPRLEPRPGRSIAVIRAQPSDIARLFESGSDIVTTVNDVLNRVSAILSDENAERLSHAIENFDKLTTAIGSESESIKTILNEGALASAELTRTLSQVRTTVARLEQTIGNADRILDSDVATAMTALRDASVQLQGMLESNRGAVDQFAQQTLVELGQTLSELRVVLVNLGDLTQRLENNPSGFLLGRDQPKEFEP